MFKIQLISRFITQLVKKLHLWSLCDMKEDVLQFFEYKYFSEFYKLFLGFYKSQFSGTTFVLVEKLLLLVYGLFRNSKNLTFIRVRRHKTLNDAIYIYCVCVATIINTEHRYFFTLLDINYLAVSWEISNKERVGHIFFRILFNLKNFFGHFNCHTPPNVSSYLSQATLCLMIWGCLGHVCRIPIFA